MHTYRLVRQHPLDDLEGQLLVAFRKREPSAPHLSDVLKSERKLNKSRGRHAFALYIDVKCLEKQR